IVPPDQRLVILLLSGTPSNPTIVNSREHEAIIIIILQKYLKKTILLRALSITRKGIINKGKAINSSNLLAE
ncbi:hypothetical protein NE699_25705, partial [Escherichia coli]|uniref:hypothetical protein n=1 Tax=Escherichia coli TaxID=562 RepID=UPI00210CCB26